MPPPSGRYGGPQGLSNGPFGHLNPSIPPPGHMHQQHAGVPQSMTGAHAGFGGAGAGSNPNAFGHGMGNAQLQAAFGGGPSGMGPTGLGGGRSGLESDAARMGFAHGATIQQQQASMGVHTGMDAPGLGHSNAKAKGISPRIREVWKGNLEDEFKILMSLVEKYPYISMVRLILLPTPFKRPDVLMTHRIRNSLASLHDPWAISPPRPATTTKPYDVMSIFSR